MRSLWVAGGTSGIGAEVNRQASNSEKWDRIWCTGEKTADLLSTGDVIDFVEEHGPFDDVVYTAGMADLRWIKDTRDADFMSVMDLNCLGFLRVLRALQLKQKAGSIVAVTSDAAYNPMRGSLSYCVSKAALTMVIRCAAREMAPRWRINGVAPSVVEGTPMTRFIDRSVPEFRGWDPLKAQEYERAQIPMGRRCRPEEVAQVILNTLEGPEFMTGTIVNITGGK